MKRAHYDRENHPVLCGGSFTHRNIPMSLSRFHHDGYIVAEGFQNHDEARLRVTTNVTTQDSGDVRLADASPWRVSANESDDINLPELL